MKYVILIYQPSPFDPKAFSDEQYKANSKAYKDLAALPNVEPGLPLGLPKDAVTIRVHDGAVERSDGPYVDAAGAVGGYFVVDVENVEEAISLAARVPAAGLGGAVEVRPAEAYWGR